MLKTKCEWCGKPLIMGHDRYFTVGIHFQDPSGNNIYDKTKKKQYLNFCEECEKRAKYIFEFTLKEFNE